MGVPFTRNETFFRIIFFLIGISFEEVLYSIKYQVQPLPTTLNRYSA
jgi:hypothetical protein